MSDEVVLAQGRTFRTAEGKRAFVVSENADKTWNVAIEGWSYLARHYQGGGSDEHIDFNLVKPD